VTTPSQTVGPFFTIGLCREAANKLVPAGRTVAGRLLDGAGAPVPDGLIEAWDGARWGRCGTDGEGRFSFVVDHGCSHLDVLVFARGLLRHLATRIELQADADEPFDINLQESTFFA
jgi:protocatechuate 3,4-dioxygenase, alpha subunit